MTLPLPTAPQHTALARALDHDVADDALGLPDDVPDAIWQRALLGPAQEFLRRPGKALRARLVELGWELGGGAPGAVPASLPSVVEALHAGSLIVDDVQDDSDERRGAPALHRLVGVARAINTGNWMYFWALDRLGRDLTGAAHAAALRAAVDTLMACHHGQALDLSVRVTDLPQADVPAVVAATTRLKTGALMGFAARLGALGAGADEARTAAIAALGEAAGVGLQMLDDLGSICARDRADKGREDLRAGRPTWPWAWLAEARDEVAWARLALRARHAPESGDAELDALADALRREIEPRGRDAVRSRLGNAMTDARAALGEHPALDEMAAALGRMEQSYG